MCGIVAVITKDRPVSRESLEDAVRVLSPRGPDEQHLWISPGQLAGLGHARLSIIDTETGSQPIPNEEDDMRIIVNGEFYDYKRIRRELEKEGHRFRTRSDSEIALHLYEEYGTGCLGHLRGEFAFAIWDENNQTLFAARDRFGIKPLFYYQDADKLILASEAKAIFAAGVNPEWDTESVYQNLFFTFDQDRSLFKGVRQVPPGHYLTARGAKVRIEQYWDVNYPKKNGSQDYESEEECIGKVRELLDEAIGFRMQADVPVGCYLSGGVDSSSVLGIASRHAKRKITAFTIAFDHKDFDESASAGRTAAFSGVDFNPIRVTASDFADVFEESVITGEMVHYNGHGAARYHLSRAVKAAGYKVVIGGEGADELFAGYDFSSRAVLENRMAGGMAHWPGFFVRLMRRNNATERRIANASPWLARLSKVLAFPPHLIGYMADKFDIIDSIIGVQLRQKHGNRDPYREFFRQFVWRKTLFGREPAKQIIYLWMKSLFANYVLAAERLDMANAVEVRLPFLDHKLFDFAKSIPVSTLAKGGRLKYVLREAVKPYVTEEVYRAEKQPFLAPPTVMRTDNPMYNMLQDLLRSKSYSDVPFFDHASLLGILDRLREMDAGERASMDPVLFVTASLGILHKKYGL